jgi:hypothetical protein
VKELVAMVFTFGTPSRVTSLDRLSRVARRQARLCWLVTGAELAGHATVGVEVRWSVVCDQRGVPVADVWCVQGMTLLFRAASTEFIGYAVDGCFVCRDEALRAVIGASHDIGELAEATPDTLRSGALESGTFECEAAPDTLREVA